MTDNKAAKPLPPATEEGKTESGPDEALDGTSPVRAAEDAVRRAKEELQKAQELYLDVRRQATDQLREVRSKTVGELIDGVLGLVKKHPGPGVAIAALVGVFLGRLFRR